MMRPRIIGLSLGAVAILGFLVYLFLQATDDSAPVVPSTASDEPRARPTAPKPPEAGSAEPRFRPGSGATPRVDPARPRVDFTTGGGTVSRSDPRLDPGEDSGPNPEVDLELAMDEANKAYDHNEYETAVKQALKVLAATPGNVRMLRIVVSSACLMGDVEVATKYLGELPARDQSDMVKRCSRSEITLKPTKPALPAGGG